MAARFLLETPYGAMFDDQATPITIATLVENVLALGTIFVAEHYSNDADRRIVGMLAIVVLPHPLTGRKYADEICWWVEPEDRNGTLGPKMLRLAEDWATSQGANMVKMVAPANSTVGNFYKAIGYQAAEQAYIKRI